MTARSENEADQIDLDVFRTFSVRYLAAWNSHRPTEVSACAAEDVIWDSPALAKPASSRAEIADLVNATTTAFPDYRFTRPSPWAIAEDRRTAYIPWRMTGTNTGRFEPPGYAPTNKQVDLPGVDVMRFRDGLIWRYQSLYNYSLIARQLGLAPPRGGSIERLSVHAQRLLVRVRPRR